MAEILLNRAGMLSSTRPNRPGCESGFADTLLTFMIIGKIMTAGITMKIGTTSGTGISGLIGGTGAT